MARDDDLLGGTIKAAIAMMLRWIPEEHAWHGAWRKFMRGNGGGVGVA
jgi:hypothetical protein